MKKLFAMLMALSVWLIAIPALANLDDTKMTIAQKYGDYRLVIDTDNQPWTKEQWEKSGQKKAQADTYTYRFRREDIGINLDVKYENDRADSFVRMQRFTPDLPFQIKDFKKMFPEIHVLLSDSETVVFTTYKDLSRNLMEKNSPVTLGAAYKKDPSPERKGHFTLMAFNIQDEGRLIKDPKYIDENTYIREFTLERTYMAVLKDNLTVEWKPAPNYFSPSSQPATPTKSDKTKKSGKK